MRYCTVCMEVYADIWKNRSIDLHWHNMQQQASFVIGRVKGFPRKGSFPGWGMSIFLTLSIPPVGKTIDQSQVNLPQISWISPDLLLTCPSTASLSFNNISILDMLCSSLLSYMLVFFDSFAATSSILGVCETHVFSTWNMWVSHNQAIMSFAFLIYKVYVA